MVLRAQFLVAVGAFVLSACAVDSEPELDARVANISSDSQGRVGAAVRLVDDEGNAVSMAGGATSITVDTRSAGEDWQPAGDVVADATGRALVDVVVVADNSGSQAEHLPQMREAIEHFADVLLASAHGDRVGLVRVSTVASVLNDLTESPDDMGSALDEMFVTNGWTALWDGIRLGNEVLAAGAVERADDSLCIDRAYRSLLVFTDGRDNNSADEHDTRYEGDGIDTTLDQLLELRVNDQPTAIYTVGIGDGVDEPALEALAANAGGDYRAIANYMGLLGAFHGAAAQLASQVPVCFTPASCEHTEARVTISYRERGKVKVVERDFFIQSDCPAQ